jgi:4-amino-4-deoxychorismate lyase
MKIWLNDVIMDEREAVIPATDHGFLYGIGLFETFRTYGGKPFLLERHLSRLADGCQTLRINVSLDIYRIVDQVEKILAVNALSDAYIRLSVSAGSAPLGLPSLDSYKQPNVMMMAKALPQSVAIPKTLMVLALPRSNPEGPIRQKSFHYMNNILAKWEMSERSAPQHAEGLFLNAQGYVTEGIVSNVFFVHHGTLCTPSVSTGCLPGITRALLLELATANDIAIDEGLYTWEDVAQAEEVLVTNSIQEITAVDTLIDATDRMIQRWSHVPGPVTALLQHAYRARIQGG